MPGKKELPDTLKRSSRSAQHMWVKVHDNAVDEYGEGEKAHRSRHGRRSKRTSRSRATSG